MKRYITVVFLFLLLHPIIIRAQIGAKAQQGSGIQGIWTNTQFGYQMTLMLNADGSGEFDGEPMKYTVAGTKLTLNLSGVSTQYNFTQQGNSLTLSGGDIDGSIVFSRAGAVNTAPSSNRPSTQQKNSVASATGGSADIVGVWSGNGETIEFNKNGQCIYAGQTFGYQLSGNSIILQAAQGSAAMGYSLSGNQLTLTVNGQSFTYSRGGAGTTGTGQAQPAAGNKRVAQELVGKWCWTNVTSTNSGGRTSERCITLNGDGTYQYEAESSMSVNSNAYYGGTNSQSSDRGTWSYDGVRIYYNSQAGQGSGSYLLEKRNHPKNNDPMIVLDGETYVTYYQKPRW
ncbi:MAG TPA: hypothetical protein PLV21_12140 [Cyclobacteriaceae bacterium]|nr:hypothetical protein [Cyclobacteriaceae bacterium]HRJ82631.1 hypothetical protein [Cyclobacteriaceae bacterium]